MANKKKITGALEVSGSIVSIEEPLVVEAKKIIWEDLVALRDAGELIPGQQYRITDYECTTVQENTQSAGHVFDIIVVADTPDTLNENARACLHEGDTYFTNSKLEAWKLMYCLDNDTTRFAWALDKTIKVIKCYEAESEIYIHIRCPEEDVDGKFAWAYTNVNSSRDLDSFSIDELLENVDRADLGFTSTEEIIAGETIFEYAGYSSPVIDYIKMGGKGVIYRMIDEYNNDVPYDFKNMMFLVSGEYIYTFHYYDGWEGEEYDLSLNQHMLFDFIDEEYTTTEIGCHTNIIKPYYNQTDGTDIGHGRLQLLNFITFRNFSEDDGGGGLRTHCCYSNFFDFGCRNVSFGKCCSLNSFGCDCRDSAFGDNCNYNRFGKNNRLNTLGANCTSSTFGNSCSNNTFGNDCINNNFGIGCSSNTFGIGCSSNTFGNSCSNNTYGDGCYANTFGNDCSSSTFGNGCGNNTFGAGCNYLQISDSSGTQKRYVSVDSGVNGASSANKFDLYDAEILNKNYQVSFKKSASGKYLMLWATDTGTMTGKYKSNNTDTTWEDIV